MSESVYWNLPCGVSTASDRRVTMSPGFSSIAAGVTVEAEPAMSSTGGKGEPVTRTALGRSL
jgi:hypothetical protein